MRGAILLCLLLLASSVLGSAEQPREDHTWCDGSGVCYSVHLAHLPFSGALEACALRGGALSTASGEAEVRPILALLRAVAAEPGACVFWLGLLREAQHCTQPQLPLRGFSWTPGPPRAPQGELDKWVREPSRSCTTRRCAGLQVTAGPRDLEPWGWEERSCRSPAQGYVCKYRYDGACPAPRPQGARSLLYSLPYRLRSAALDFSPPGTALLVACPAPQGDVQLLCELGEGGYSWAGAGEPLCPCPSGYQSPRTGACLEPGDCTSAQGAFLCVCARGFLLGPDERSCVRPGHSGGAPSAAPASSVFLLVTMAVVTVVILVVAVLGVFKLCFAQRPSSAGGEGSEPAPAAAAGSDAEADSSRSRSESSLEARSTEAGGDQAEILQREEAPPGS